MKKYSYLILLIVFTIFFTNGSVGAAPTSGLLEGSLEINRDLLYENENIIFTTRVKNRVANTSISGLKIESAIPSGFVIVSHNAKVDGSPIGTSVTGNTVTTDSVTIYDETLVLEVVAKAIRIGKYTNEVEIVSEDMEMSLSLDMEVLKRTVVDPDPDPDPKPDPDPDPDPKPDPEPEPKPDPEPIPEVEPKEDVIIEINENEIPLGGKLNMEDHLQYIFGYVDGSVRPEANITREEVSAVFYRLMTSEYRREVYSNEKFFPDVAEGRWSFDNISSLYKAKVISGYPDGTFRPERYISRSEVAVLASKFDNLSYSGPNKFTDIEGHWAEAYINSAALKGWIVGDNSGKFRPDDNITRAEFITLVNGVLNRKTRLENMLAGRKVFTDLNESEKKWYFEEIEEAVNGHDYDRLEDGTEKWTQLIYKTYGELYGIK